MKLNFLQLAGELCSPVLRTFSVGPPYCDLFVLLVADGTCDASFSTYHDPHIDSSKNGVQCILSGDLLSLNLGVKK